MSNSEKVLAPTNGINRSLAFEANTAIAISDQALSENILIYKSFPCVVPEIDAYH
jgi:hypothetical protein